MVQLWEAEKQLLLDRWAMAMCGWILLQRSVSHRERRKRLIRSTHVAPKCQRMTGDKLIRSKIIPSNRSLGTVTDLVELDKGWLAWPFSIFCGNLQR